MDQPIRWISLAALGSALLMSGCGQAARAKPPLPAYVTVAPSPFGVAARVLPASMPSGAYPTLHADTTPGALCTATITDTTGKRPPSFHGSRQKADIGGNVNWSWHEQSAGGVARVSCVYHGRMKTGSAAFTVTKG